MALVGGHRRRARIGGAALVLTVAAGMGPGEAVGASIAAPPSVTTGDSGRVPPTFSSDVVRGFESLQRPARTESKPTKANGKVIHLTFDDGPSARHTRPILDLLDRYDAKATFFQVGENAVDHPGLTRAVIARGHALGSHTWNHRDLRRLKGGRLDEQITRTSSTLSRISGRPVTCLRPPYGATNQRVKAAVRHRKLALTLWDIDPRDWKDVVWAITTRVDPVRDTVLVDHTPIDSLDFASPVSGLGSKLGIDATNKWPQETDRQWGQPIEMDEEVKRRVDALWASLGL